MINAYRDHVGVEGVLPGPERADEQLLPLWAMSIGAGTRSSSCQRSVCVGEGRYRPELRSPAHFIDLVLLP